MIFITMIKFLLLFASWDNLLPNRCFFEFVVFCVKQSLIIDKRIQNPLTYRFQLGHLYDKRIGILS